MKERKKEILYKKGVLRTSFPRRGVTVLSLTPKKVDLWRYPAGGGGSGKQSKKHSIGLGRRVQC